MTTSDNNRSFRYQGNGVSDTFSFPARIFTSNDVVVEIITRATDAFVETLTISTDYSVTIIDEENASFQITNASKVPSSTQDIQLRSSLSKVQTVDLPTGTVFPAKSVEDALDRVTVIVQEVSGDIDRSIKLPATSSLSSVSLPTPASSELIGWNLAADDLTTYSFGDLSGSIDTVFTTLLANDFLQYDGSDWVNKTPAEVKVSLGVSYSEPTATITASDNILFSDVDDSNNVKKTTVQGVIDLVPEFPVTTKGDLLTFDTDDARLPVGTDKQVLRADSAETTGLSWAPDYFGGQLLHMQDQKPNNTNGGTNAIGSFVARTLNTVLTNEISGASLSSNQITLPAGTYYIEASMPILGVRGHRGRLQNITDASTEVQGTTGFAGDSVPASESRSHVFGRFTIAGTKVFEVQQYTNTQKITNGYGGGDFGPDGNAAIYSDAKIWKVG